MMELKSNISHFLVLLVITISFYSSTGYASSQFSDDEFIPPVKSRMDRLKDLSLIESEVEGLNAEVPNPKPAEIEWLNKEESEIEQVRNSNIINTHINEDSEELKQRRFNMISSIAYNEKELKDKFNMAIHYINEIKSTQYENDEMVFWVKLAELLSNPDDINNSLENIYPDKKFNPGNADILAIDVQESLNNIVIPFIKNKTKSGSCPPPPLIQIYLVVNND